MQVQLWFLLYLNASYECVSINKTNFTNRAYYHKAASHFIHQFLTISYFVRSPNHPNHYTLSEKISSAKLPEYLFLIHSDVPVPMQRGWIRVYASFASKLEGYLEFSLTNLQPRCAFQIG